MALSSLPWFMAVLVLATAAIMQAPQRALVAATASSYVDVCDDSNLACAEVRVSMVTFRSIFYHTCASFSNYFSEHAIINVVNSGVDLCAQVGVVLRRKIAISANVRSSFHLLLRDFQTLGEQKRYGFLAFTALLRRLHLDTFPL